MDIAFVLQGIASGLVGVFLIATARRVSRHKGGDRYFLRVASLFVLYFFGFVAILLAAFFLLLGLA